MPRQMLSFREFHHLDFFILSLVFYNFIAQQEIKPSANRYNKYVTQNQKS